MQWTDEQLAVLDHRADAHAVVRAAPGAGKTTTLVARVARLIERGVDPASVRVVMFNRAVQETFAGRLGSRAVKVTTFDALGLEVLRVAERRKLLSKPLKVVADLTTRLSREIYRSRRDDFDDAEEIERAVAFWKAHLVPPGRAAFPPNPALVDAYRECEERRGEGDELRVAFEDMVYTAVGVLRRHPRLLGRIDHLLIDEFQDVNPARVELIQRLMHQETVLMVVGDEDQGINEWCGGHPKFFRDFGVTFPNRPTVEYRLARTFRFGPILAAAASRLIAQNTDRKPGVIEGGGQAGRLSVVADVGEAVRQLLSAGTPASDIAVLYRGRNQGAAVLAAMIGDGVAIQTEDVGLLRTGRGPELALGYLRAASSDEPVTLEEAWPIVFAPDRFIQKEAFAEQVRRLGRGGLRAVLGDRALATELGQGRGALRAMTDLLRLLNAMGRSASAADALDLLVDEVDVDEQLRSRLKSEREQEAAIACFHALRAFFRGSGVSPRDAAGAVANIDPQRGRPVSECVRATTIHKAKGLEWRHVFLPGLIEGACPAEQRGQVVGTREQPGGITQSPWIEQERRIFYVGVTGPPRSPTCMLLETPRAGLWPSCRSPSERAMRRAAARSVAPSRPHHSTSSGRSPGDR